MNQVMAMVHSLNGLAEVSIISENGCNHVIADYNGLRYTAIFNIFSGLYYVDDVYGIIK